MLKTVQNFSIESDVRGEVYVHTSTGVRFRRLPSGNYPMGVSTSEMQQVAKMDFTGDIDGFATVREVRSARIAELLVSECPLTNRHVKLLTGKDAPIDKYADPEGPDDVSKLRIDWVRKNLLSELFDLPTSDELEAICRGALKREMFPWGNTLLSSKDLKNWMKLKFRRPTDLPSNAIGLVGLSCGAWSKTPFDFTLAAKQPKLRDPSRQPLSIKFPASFYWPWQTSEWVYCMNGVRSSSLELLDSKLLSVRLIVRI